MSNKDNKDYDLSKSSPKRRNISMSAMGTSLDDESSIDNSEEVDTR